MQLLDSSLFANDWFLDTQTSAFSIRAYFVYFLRMLCIALPYKVAVLMVYIASWCGIAIALYRIADLLTYNRLAAVGSVAIICLMTPFWTLGGNDLLHSMLVPSMVAWAFALWCLVAYLRSQPVFAGVLAGIATLFQALVGLQIMLILGVLLCLEVWQSTKRKNILRQLIWTCVAFGLVAIWALGPLLYQQFSAPAGNGEPSLFYIMAQFRNPHHYLYHSFNPVRTFQFFVLLGSGFLAHLALQKKNLSPRAGFINNMLAIIFVICLVGYLGTEVVQNLTIAKLQLFKTTILVKLLMVITACHLAVALLPNRLSQWLDSIAFSPAFLSVGLAVILALALIFQHDRIEKKIYPYSTANSAQHALAHWARDHTDRDVVFAVPPSWSAFRSHAARAIVINHKAFPYRDQDIYVWFSRLLDMSPIRRPERTDVTLQGMLDKQYNDLSAERLERLSFEYDFDYVIRNTPLPAASAFILAYESNGWLVYELSATRLASR